MKKLESRFFVFFDFLEIFYKFSNRFSEFSFHTDSTDVTDIFCEHESHEKGEVASLFIEPSSTSEANKFERQPLSVRCAKPASLAGR